MILKDCRAGSYLLPPQRGQRPDWVALSRWGPQNGPMLRAKALGGPLTRTAEAPQTGARLLASKDTKRGLGSEAIATVTRPPSLSRETITPVTPESNPLAGRAVFTKSPRLIGFPIGQTCQFLHLPCLFSYGRPPGLTAPSVNARRCPRGARYKTELVTSP